MKSPESSIKTNLLNLSNILDISSFIGKFPYYSDFNAVSIHCWNRENDNSFAFINGNLFLKLKDYLSDFHNYSILGENSIDETLDTIFSSGIDRLGFVPEVVVEKIHNKDKYTIAEDRDSFDYVIDLKEFSELGGHRYKSYRRRIRKYISNSVDKHVIELDHSSSRIREEIFAITSSWCKSKKFKKKELDAEIKAVKSFMELGDKFNLLSYGLYIRGQLVAFTFNEILDKSWVMGHFGKSLLEYDDSSHFLEYATALDLYKKGYRYINEQQDAGIYGLRELKMSLNPTTFLKKYIIKKI